MSGFRVNRQRSARSMGEVTQPKPAMSNSLGGRIRPMLRVFVIFALIVSLTVSSLSAADKKSRTRRASVKDAMKLLLKVNRRIIGRGIFWFTLISRRRRLKTF